jgi:hypothetical protein
MFGQRQRLRRLAAQVLLMWLFALGAGIVNACVIEPELRHAAAFAAHGQDDQHHAASHLRHDHAAGSIGHKHRSPHSSKAPCAKFCDEPSASTQPLKQQADEFNAVSLATGPISSFTLSDMSLPPGGVSGAEPERSRGAIPIPIAFLRLAL